ncbi:HlyIII-domain-containing protein [Neolentinus lepideus HHB14362 ss-1]|uniref:HlyIII-domain-containing protein n=1 Tax=Neolentinus lepideus HHB14362 ss-1 TaxID=1314782 RepID=A0A165M9S4_9AGAM|nr:HlyIII-domain-containing protein [Neolentinus lepideus HHB14362 ss-1]
MSTTTATQIRHRRHTSLSSSRPRILCQTFTHSIEALDLPTSATLASVRLLILDYLADLEKRLTESKEDSWARAGLDMLHAIRADVAAYLPELSFDLDNMPDVRAHLPELPDVRSHLPDIDFTLSRMRSRLEDAMPDMSVDLARFEFSAHRPLSYIPQLVRRLESLHAHIAVPPRAALVDAITNLSRELVEKGRHRMDEAEGAAREVREAAREVRDAIRRSFNGSKLIRYADLPDAWRNNEFVRGGYRFIPLERWPLILLSLFALHNETLNIHTHLIPFLFWLPSLIRSIPHMLLSSVPHPSAMDTPELAFTSFALLCLFCSAVWHTMAGCAHPKGMELCARVDYVGIGWLIAASVGTVVHYGFRAHPALSTLFLGFSCVMGIIGSVAPFQAWFNAREHKRWRIAFFVALALSAVAPLAAMAAVYSVGAMGRFIAPVFPSIASYLAGLVFYATHVPECFVRSERAARWLDWVGGGSHAIWHVFIVLAIWQHRQAMGVLKEGIGWVGGVSG